MVGNAWPVRSRSEWLGALTMAIAVTAGVPATVTAGIPARRIARAMPAAPSAARPITVAVGAISGDVRARPTLEAALTHASTTMPALRVATNGQPGATVVLNVHVRALTVQRFASGALARCELGIVVADGSGAVRAMLDARRTVLATLATSDAAAAQLALRSAMDGAVRNVVTGYLSADSRSR